MTAASATIAVPRAGAWLRHGVALALTAAALLLLFRRDAADMATIWWTSDTFGHCLLIAPLAAWLVWIRRRELAQLTPTGWAPGLFVVAGGGFCWLVGDAASVALARHLGLVVMLEGAVIALLGPTVARGLAFPMAYALFLVPFGEFLEAPLQAVTVRLVMPLLHLSGIPATSDGVVIHAGRYWFEVAEACSGATFVLAMLAFGVLVAQLCFRGWRRRAVFLAVCLAAPVLGNGVRAFATMWVADRFGIARASGFDHVVFGWVFFAAVMAAVTAASWRWFDRDADAPAFDPARLQGRVRWRLDPAVAALAVLATASVFPAWSSASGARAALPERLVLPEVSGWQRAPLSVRAAWTPNYPGADHFLIGRYVDPRGRMVDLVVAVYADQGEGRELVGFGIGAIRQNDRWVRVADEAPLAGGTVLRMVAPGTNGSPVERLVATWYRVGAVTTADPARVKLATLRTRLTGRPAQAVALHLSSEGDRGALADFARALGEPGAVADRIAAGG